MRLVVRSVIVALAIFIYSGIFTFVSSQLWVRSISAAFDKEEQSQQYQGQFGNAFDDSVRTDAELAAQCGYQVLAPGERIRLSHDAIVRISECLELNGLLTEDDLDGIRAYEFEFEYWRAAKGTGRGISYHADDELDFGFDTKWRLLQIVVFYIGLVGIVWLFAFRLRWPRRLRRRR